MLLLNAASISIFVTQNQALNRSAEIKGPEAYRTVRSGPDVPIQTVYDLRT